MFRRSVNMFAQAMKCLVVFAIICFYSTSVAQDEKDKSNGPVKPNVAKEIADSVYKDVLNMQEDAESSQPEVKDTKREASYEERQSVIQGDTVGIDREMDGLSYDKKERAGKVASAKIQLEQDVQDRETQAKANLGRENEEKSTIKEKEEQTSIKNSQIRNEKGKTIPTPEKPDSAEIKGYIRAISPTREQVLKSYRSFSKEEISLNPGWTNLLQETFEGSFPSGNDWTLYYNVNSSQDGYGYTWDDDDYRPHNNSWSGWCADGAFEGQPDLSPPGPYPNYLVAWMVWGPFDLSGAVDAELLFYFWNYSESNFDYFRYYASVNGSNFYGYRLSGDYRSWNFRNFDLTDVYTLGNLCGEPEVWIAFKFDSDVSNAYEGAYVDDIILRADFSSPKPNLVPYQPSGWDDKIVVSSVAGTHTDGPNLMAGDTIYVDYAYLNDSDEDIPETFYNDILIDGTVVFTSYKNGLSAHNWGYGEDRKFVVADTGWHTIAIRVDKDDDVSESNEGDNDYVRSFYLNSAGPNLVPYQPSGWDDKIVVSSVAGTHTDGPNLMAGDTIYVDYAYLNDSDEDIPETFYNDILIDGTVVFTSYKNGLPAHNWGYGEDRKFVVADTGWHTIAIRVDKDDDVSESNEGDNDYVRSFYLNSAGPNLVPYQPSGWDDKIVVSSVAGTHTDGPNLIAGDTIYVDYAYLNDSDEDIPETFYNDILIDGTVVFTSYKNGLPAHNWGYGEDRTFVVDGAEWHTIAIRVDKDDDVSESNEGDNDYVRTFYLDPQGDPDIHVYPSVLKIYQE